MKKKENKDRILYIERRASAKGYIGDKDMKKIILIAAMAAISMMTVSCGSTNDNTNSLTTAQQPVVSQAAGKDSYSVIPQQAEKALGAAADRSASAYEIDGTRSFGYTGTRKVNGSECYCFSMFSTKDESTYHIADLAVTSDGEKVFASDAGKNDFKKLEEHSDLSGWNAKKTAAFDK